MTNEDKEKIVRAYYEASGIYFALINRFYDEFDKRDIESGVDFTIEEAYKLSECRNIIYGICGKKARGKEQQSEGECGC